MTDLQETGYRVSDVAEPLHQTRGGSLIIDGAGLIVACNPPVMATLGWSAEDLVGLPVRLVFPELPFASSTPGYNVAYAVFNSTEGVWVRRTALSARGMTIPVDTVLSKTMVEGKPCIALTLCAPLAVPALHAPALLADPGRPALSPTA